MRFLAPIILFTYNRPFHTRQTIEALRKNELAAKSDLFVFSDAPKNEAAKESVRQVREYIKTIKGFKSIKVTEREFNYGLANSVISGVSEIINQYGKVIVLEDDHITSPFFLKYMNEALDMYENESEVISVHGYIYPISAPLPETFFIKGADCWGWATWKRGWDLFEANGGKLLQQIIEQKKQNEFDFNNSYPFLQMLKDQVAGKNSSWAVRWYASAFLENKLTLYPGKSLILNIGMDSSGTHAGRSTEFDIQLNESPIELKPISVQESILARKQIERYFRSALPGLVRRLLRKIRAFK